ncbi:hypothetical protein DdX_10296 [Ditylenchus destructor]|uniref:Uncharacterized protein n=1 Tax=Ditylenchus destructor TaxID=166010 RepID=A0AAD4N4X2_9BILA|nr:hypothetical protein DdX_10296 [Ditylenchus destructor]
MTHKWLLKMLVFELLSVYSGFPACLNLRNLFRKIAVVEPLIEAPRLVPPVGDPMLVPRNIRGIVQVKFPENICKPKSIVVILQGYLPDPRTQEIQLSQCKEDKCKYEFKFSSALKQRYALGVKLGGTDADEEHKAWLKMGQNITISSKFVLEMNIVYDLTGNIPKVNPMR